MSVDSISGPDLTDSDRSYNIESQSASDQLSGAIRTLNSKMESLLPLLELSSSANVSGDPFRV